nr:ABC transporter permease [Leucobacter exalbidus]
MRAQKEKPELTPAQVAAKRAKAENIGRYVAMFIMPIIIVGMMITSYLGTMHSPTPRDVPILVTGSSEAVETFSDALVENEKYAVDVSTVDSALEARDAVFNREAVAAVAIDHGTATLYTAGGAGATIGNTVTAMVTPIVLEQGLTLDLQDVAPMPENDMSGLGAMFLATALVMAGYLPFSTLRSNSPELLKFRKIVPLLAGWAALIAGLVWVITGPVLDVVALEHSWAVIGIAWLGVFAISCVQLFITRVVGALGVIVGMFLLMVLGMPASNMSLSMYTMPSFFRFLHEILPMPAIGEAMRSVLYFDGVGVTPHLLVLAVGAVVGLLSTKAYDARERKTHPQGRDLDINMASLHGGPRPKTKFWRYFSLFLFPFLMVTMMITCMLGAMHAVAPKDMPVAVVGSSIEQAQQTIDGLEENMDGYFEFTAMDNADDAESLVQNRDIVAAFVLPSQEAPQFTLIGNQAGNGSAYMVAQQVFTPVAAAQQMPLEINNLQALPDRDSAGVVTMYIAMGWILAGFMIVVVAANAQPKSRPLKRMLPITAAYSVMMSALLYLIAGPITGAISGHFFALWGAGAFAIFCIAMFALVFERLMGMLAVLPVVGLLMFLGVPASNGAFSIYMAPEWFRTLYELLPMPAAVEMVRSILYFDGDVVAHHMQVLGLWGAISLAIVILIDAVKGVRTEPDFNGHSMWVKAQTAAITVVATDAPAPAVIEAGEAIETAEIVETIDAIEAPTAAPDLGAHAAPQPAAELAADLDPDLAPAK